VDISERFVEPGRREAPAGATFVRGDARALGYDSEFDAVISLCQGAFGLAGGPGAPLDPDGAVLAGMARALKPGGRLALTAFSAYFQVRHLDEGTDMAGFDAERGVNHEVFMIRDPDGRTAEYDAWTTCFTPRELRLMVTGAGLETTALYSVEPGDYARRPPGLDHPEFLVLARRPA
jgi:Methylase involved in ubiquinone/menaquinone biosynthesis